VSAPTVEATVPAPQRRLVAAGKKFGAGRIAWSYPMSQADIDAHASSSFVSPSALTDEERKELSDKVREANKRSTRR
jgi:hypothetical protein